jgi:hypothetical protein
VECEVSCGDDIRRVSAEAQKMNAVGQSGGFAEFNQSVQVWTVSTVYEVHIWRTNLRDAQFCDFNKVFQSLVLMRTAYADAHDCVSCDPQFLPDTRVGDFYREIGQAVLYGPHLLLWHARHTNRSICDDR